MPLRSPLQLPVLVHVIDPVGCYTKKARALRSNWSSADSCVAYAVMHSQNLSPSCHAEIAPAAMQKFAGK